MVDVQVIREAITTWVRRSVPRLRDNKHRGKCGGQDFPYP